MAFSYLLILCGFFALQRSNAIKLPGVTDPSTVANDNRLCASNAECLAKGLPLLRPRRLHSYHERDIPPPTVLGCSNTVTTYTSPQAGTYFFSVQGAQGGTYTSDSVNIGGSGQVVNATYTLTAGQELQIVVGCAGSSETLWRWWRWIICLLYRRDRANFCCWRRRGSSIPFNILL